MEAFSDAIIAIAITIMVLELRVPHGTTWGALQELLPGLFTYVLSFIYLGIYWNNHHHMLMATAQVFGPVLWANLHLLFWLSLIPFTTAWMGEHRFAATPVAVYGLVLLGASVAYYILQTSIIRVQGPASPLASAIGRDIKGKVSVVLYATGVLLTFANRWAALATYVVVALIWLVPDRRVERMIAAGQTPRGGAERT